jgi:hypothetical protein
MTQPSLSDHQTGASRFRGTLVRVMTVQIVTLIALWLLQRHFSI